MPMGCRCLLLAPTILVSTSAVRLRTQRICEDDLVSYALMTQRVCEFNWAINPKSFRVFNNDPGVQNVSWAATAEVGDCWRIQTFNTDSSMTSAVYQNVNDSRCVLAISGYHGGENGVFKTMIAATQPAEKWNMCSNQMHAPVVKQFRQHTSLKNWSKNVEFLAGKQSTCSSIVITGESMGGSVAEALVGCGTLGQMDELQPKSLPFFNIQAIYTFGAFAASVSPIMNYSSADGCITGKRMFHSNDVFAQWAKKVGLKHPYMDAVRLDQKDHAYTSEPLHCLDTASLDSDSDFPALNMQDPLAAFRSFKTKEVGKKSEVGILAAHTIPHYVKQMRALAGQNPPMLVDMMPDYAGVLREMETTY